MDADLMSVLHPSFGIIPVKHSKVRHLRIDLTMIIKILYSLQYHTMTKTELITASHMRFRKGALSYIRFCEASSLIRRTETGYALTEKGSILLSMFITERNFITGTI